MRANSLKPVLTASARLITWLVAFSVLALLPPAVGTQAVAEALASVHVDDPAPASTTTLHNPRTDAGSGERASAERSRSSTSSFAPVVAPKAGGGPVRLPARESFGNPAKLDDHFRRHGGDLGASSADDYAAKASDFLESSQRQRLPTKIDADGVVRVYDPRSNTFGAYNPGGTTRTFFKPSSPGYFDRQPGAAPRP